jgi:hypothetical protein
MLTELCPSQQHLRCKHVNELVVAFIPRETHTQCGGFETRGKSRGVYNDAGLHRTHVFNISMTDLMAIHGSKTRIDNCLPCQPYEFIREILSNPMGSMVHVPCQLALQNGYDRMFHL